MRKFMAKSEKGEIMIESMLTLIPTLFVLIFLIGLGFLLYQHWNIQYTADDIANKVATSFSYYTSELSTNEITKTDIKERELYRYLFQIDKYNTEAKNRGENYGDEMLDFTTFANPIGDENIEISEAESDSLARRHITVKVTGKYKIPFCEGLEIFGISGEQTYVATSVAECVDLVDYVGTVNYVKNCNSMLQITNLGVIKAVNSWMKALNHIIDHD